MIFPQKLDMHGRSDIADVRRMTERYINDMQRLIEANDSNLRKRIAALENADATAAAALKVSLAGITEVEETTASGLELLAQAVSDVYDMLSTSGPILYKNAEDIYAADGETVYFTVKVIYSSTVTYAWQLRWGSDWTTPGFAGVNTDTLTVPATTARNGYQFRCTITAGGFTIYSKTVTLHVS